MEQTPTIDSIKKCKQDSRTLSLQETDDPIGAVENGCSTFMSSIGLLAQGEFWNKKMFARNAVVTFRDPKTGIVKGRIFNFVLVSFQSF